MTTTFTAALMGVNFRPAETRELVKDQANFETLRLRLERDPENEYDSNAVKVIATDDDDREHFVGFVQREVAADIAPLMDQGADLTVKVIGWLGTIKPALEIELDDDI